MRMLQIILLLGLSPFIFGQEAEFFGCCMFKEVQGTTMMVDRYLFLYGDAGNDDGRMAKMKTRVKTWMVMMFLAMFSPGEGGLAGVYYLVQSDSDQPLPDVCSL